MLTLIRRPDDRAFTLVETLAALLVFSLVTLGIVPLVLSSIRGTTTSRSLTIGKNVALEAMERIRGLPYRVEYTRQPPTTRVDFLDLFYPDAAGGTFPGQSYADGLFTTVCETTSTNPACQSTRLPTELGNFELVIRVCFLAADFDECIDDPDGRTDPAADYAWNGENDGAARQIVELSVAAHWTIGSTPRNFDLRTLLSDRDFGGREVRSTAAIDHIAHIITGLEDEDSGVTSSVRATFGIAESTTELTDLQVLARERAEAGRLRLADTTDPDNEIELDVADGAAVIVEAPPDEAFVDSGQTVTASVEHDSGHPLAGAGVLAFLDSSSVDDAAAVVADPLLASAPPTAFGDLALGDAGVTNDPNSTRSELQLAPNRSVIEILGGTSASTTTSTTDIAAGGGVSSAATMSVPLIEVFPVTFINPTTNPADGIFDDVSSVLVIDDLTVTATCEASLTSAEVATVAWSATLGYWQDTSNNGISDGTWATVSLSDTELTDPLSAFTASGNNPVVFEAPGSTEGIGDAEDVHLFPVEHDHGGGIVHQHDGYLDPAGGWSSRVRAVAGSLEEASEDDGRTVRAGVSDVIQIKTVPVSNATNASAFNLSLGSLSCTADDQR